MKTTSLATKPVCLDGNNHSKTIKQGTNEFDATTNEINNHHLDTEDNSVESKDTTERETDPRDWKDQDMAKFILSTIPNTNIKPTLYRSKEYEEDNLSSNPKKKEIQFTFRMPFKTKKPRKEDCHIPQRIATTILKTMIRFTAPQIVPTIERATKIQTQNLLFSITPAF